jgi:HK97 gp10 family phage protein
MLLRANAIGVLLQNEVRELISVSGRTIAFQRTSRGKYRKVVGALGSNPSKPGEPPHKQTGALRASITYRVEQDANGIKIIVGSALPYARVLELGSSRMAPRPFLRRALKENAERIRQIAEHGETYDISVGA